MSLRKTGTHFSGTCAEEQKRGCAIIAAPLVSCLGTHERCAMPDDVILSWLLRPLPIWMMLFLGAVPAVIAHASRRPVTPWCIYGFGCALVAWPLVALPTLHALLTRPRRAKNGGTSEQDRERQRRADAL